MPDTFQALQIYAIVEFLHGQFVFGLADPKMSMCGSPPPFQCQSYATDSKCHKNGNAGFFSSLVFSSPVKRVFLYAESFDVR